MTEVEVEEEDNKVEGTVEAEGVGFVDEAAVGAAIVVVVAAVDVFDVVVVVAGVVVVVSEVAFVGGGAVFVLGAATPVNFSSNLSLCN